MSCPPDRRIIVGQVSGIYGVKGWVKLFSHTSPRDNLLGYARLELGRGDSWRKASLVEGRTQGKKLVGRFEGIDDRDAAAALVGAEIAVRRSELPEPDEAEYYWVDLIGLNVTNTEGEMLGSVDGLVETGAHDVLVVKGDRERLIPFVMGEIVRDVDLDGGLILVDWSAGF